MTEPGKKEEPKNIDLTPLKETQFAPLLKIVETEDNPWATSTIKSFLIQVANTLRQEDLGIIPIIGTQNLIELKANAQTGVYEPLHLVARATLKGEITTREEVVTTLAPAKPQSEKPLKLKPEKLKENSPSFDDEPFSTCYAWPTSIPNLYLIQLISEPSQEGSVSVSERLLHLPPSVLPSFQIKFEEKETTPASPFIQQIYQLADLGASSQEVH
jgi:hypothetical protein